VKQGGQMIRFACPACGKVYNASDDQAGKKSVCKKCDAVVLIPNQPVKVVLYGKVLPPEGMVDPDPEPEKPVRATTHKNRQRTDEHKDAEEEQDPPLGTVLKPVKVTAIGGMLIGGGAWAIFASLFSILIFPLFVCWPGIYFGIVWAIFAIIKGAGLLGNRWFLYNPHNILILQIVQAVNFDIVNVALGVVGLVFLNEREVGKSFKEQ
jgi:hypothetical protein